MKTKTLTTIILIIAALNAQAQDNIPQPPIAAMIACGTQADIMRGAASFRDYGRPESEVIEVEMQNRYKGFPADDIQVKGMKAAISMVYHLDPYRLMPPLAVREYAYRDCMNYFQENGAK